MKKLICLCCLLCTVAAHAQTRSDSLHIAHYDLNLSLNVRESTIAGFADLKVVPKIQQLPHINLDLLAFTVDSIIVNDENAHFSRRIELLHIPLTTPANLDDTINVRVYYHGTPEMHTGTFGGFHFANDYAYNLGVSMDSYPHNFGRVWYPCLDVFDDKSTYTFNITTENNKMAICGGELVDTATLHDGKKLWRWRLDEPIPTYLSSIAVGNYELYSDTFTSISGREIPITIYAPPAFINNVHASFINLKTVLTIYESSFGAYRWNRVGYVLVGFNYGAMEHATNIAYPQLAVDGTLNNESLAMHELAHSWFGNLVTCNRAEEMWLNEGFATYCEALYKESRFTDIPQTVDEYAEIINEKHARTLKNIALDDGGYYALDDVPQHITYGTTSYDRGALVVHTLRHYMGDSLFFDGITAMLNAYQFANISSQELFDFLSARSGINLQDFYEAWVHQPGFLHFAIDSIRPSGNAGEYRVFVRQRRHHAPNFGNSNKVELTFFSADNQQVTTDFRFSGEFGVATITLPFEPIFGVVDVHNKMSAAVIKEPFSIPRSGFYNTQESDFTAQITNFTAETPALMVVEHHFVAPDAPKNDNPNIYRLSNNHFWRVEMVNSAEMQGKLGFYYNFMNDQKIDFNLLDGYSLNDLVLLYRRDAADDWRIIHSTLQSNGKADWIFSKEIVPGEYCLAVGNRGAAAISDEKESNSLHLFPNPTEGNLTITAARGQDLSHVECFDLQGKLLHTFTLTGETTTVQLPQLPSGIYILNFMDTRAQLVDSRKLTIQKYKQ